MNSMSEEPDELSLSALRTMVKTYGQMPSQLFHSPHLPHLTGGGQHSASKISFVTFSGFKSSVFPKGIREKIGRFIYNFWRIVNFKITGACEPGADIS